jgi:hypothetical protein
MKWVQDSVQPIPCPATLRSRQRSSSALSEVSLWACRGAWCTCRSTWENDRRAVLPALSLAVTLFSVLLP